MNANELFPVRLSAHNNNGNGGGNYGFRSLFHNTKRPHQIWYAYETLIHSPSDVEFVVFDMLDSVYGGVGNEIYRYRTPADPAITMPEIRGAAISLAEEIRKRELNRAEDEIIARYAESILTALAEDQP
jgi:hypothetical protein